MIFQICGLCEHDNSLPNNVTIDLLPTERFIKIIELLYDKGKGLPILFLHIGRMLIYLGYHDVCGFRYGDAVINPWVSHIDPVVVEVTSARSTYDLQSGLKINEHESFALFAENFTRADEEGNVVTSMNAELDSDNFRIRVSDLHGAEHSSVGISLDRTLRVPEDDVQYNAPALFSPFPLTQTKHHGAALPDDVQAKGGLLIPMYQREAVALTFHGKYCDTRDFALRIMAGTVNSMTSEQKHETTKNPQGKSQNYVVVPEQMRLDGFASGPGVVRQFVSMPLGLGYTAEGQLTGKEDFGGFQFVIAPRRRTTCSFEEVSQQKFSSNEEGLSIGHHLHFQGKDLHKRSQSLSSMTQAHSIYQEQSLYWVNPTLRSRFVSEVLQQHLKSRLLSSSASSQSIGLEPVFAITIRVVMQSLDKYIAVSHIDIKNLQRLNCTPSLGNLAAKTSFSFDISPFLDATRFLELIKKRVGSERIVLFLAGEELLFPDDSVYVPIMNAMSKSSTLVCQAYKVNAVTELSVAAQIDLGIYRYGDTSVSSAALGRGESQKVRTGASWEMGLAAGGQILQDIVLDERPDSWSWHHACFVNVQMVNAVIFEKFTGIPAPPTPITFRDYIKARLPFYRILGSDPKVSNSTLGELKNISQLDESGGIVKSNSITKGSHVVECSVCEEMLADTIIQPCNHIFCSGCIKETMSVGHQKIFCVACQQESTNVITIAAPMELPRKKKQISETRLTDTHGSGAKVTFLDDSVPLTEDTKDVQEQPAVDSHTIARADKRSESTTLNEEDPIVDASTSEPSEQAGGRETNDNSQVLTLVQAVQAKDLPVVERLLADGHDPNMRTEMPADAPPEITRHYTYKPETVSHIAARLGDCNTLYALHEAGADLKACGGTENWMPIHQACSAGQSAMILLLLMLQVPIEVECWPCWSDHQRDERTLTPLKVAARDGQFKIVKLLVKHGAKYEVDTKAWIRSPPAFHVAASKGHLDIVQFFTARLPVDLARPLLWPTPLCVAAKHGQVEVMRHLIDAGADINIDDYPFNPLGHAATSGSFEAVQMLVQAGATIHTDDDHRKQGYHDVVEAAAIGGSSKIVQYFLDLGCEVNPTVKPHWNANKSAIREAVARGNIGCCGVLLLRGAIVEVGVLREHWREREYAKWETSPDFCNLLIAYNAVVKNLPTLIGKLLEQKKLSLARALFDHYLCQPESHITRAELRSKVYDTIIVKVVERSDTEGLSLLISAVRRAKDDKSWPRIANPSWSSCVDIAVKKNSFDMLDLLLMSLLPEEAQKEAYRFASDHPEMAAQHIVSYMLKKYTDGRPVTEWKEEQRLRQEREEPPVREERNSKARTRDDLVLPKSPSMLVALPNAILRRVSEPIVSSAV